MKQILKVISLVKFTILALAALVARLISPVLHPIPTRAAVRAAGAKTLGISRFFSLLPRLLPFSVLFPPCDIPLLPELRPSRATVLHDFSASFTHSDRHFPPDDFRLSHCAAVNAAKSSP